MLLDYRSVVMADVADLVRKWQAKNGFAGVAHDIHLLQEASAACNLDDVPSDLMQGAF
jgi:hypothetical protein